MIYLIGLVDKIETVFMGLVIMFSVLLLIDVILTQAQENYPEKSESQKIFKGLILSITIFCSIPSNETMILMFLNSEIKDNKQIQNISDKGLKLLNLKLDKWLKQVNKKEESSWRFFK
jgi:hypothetical protein